MWIDDEVLMRFRESLAINVFVPKTPLVVLGSGNKLDLEVDESFCSRFEIPMTRRYGGGGTVVLYPGCVVITVGAWMNDSFSNTLYFKVLNQAVIDALAVTWPRLGSLSQAGISDIVMGEKKVAGTSLFRSRHYLLYQASLLVNIDRDLVGGCLKHPTKEPDYRKGRSHESFLTSLEEIEPAAKNPEDVAAQLSMHLGPSLGQYSREHLRDPIPEEFRSLEERLARSEQLPAP